MQDALVCAYHFSAEKGCKSQSLDSVISSDQSLWVHLDASHRDSAALMAALPFTVPDLAVSALLAEETRPRLTMLGEDGFLLNLRGVNLNQGADPVDMVSIRIWSNGHHIVSTRLRPLKATDDIRSSFEAGTGPATVSDFITRMIRSITLRMEPTIDIMDEKIADIEADSLHLDKKSVDHSDITDIRRSVINLRRYMVPQRDVFSALAHPTQNGESPLSEEHQYLVNESLNKLNIYLDSLDALRDRAQLIKEEMATAAADRMNGNMYVLSIIAAIFLPLGFLTGLLGINVGGIPGADNAYAFWIFIAMLVFVVAVQLYIFKRKDWL